MLDSFIPMKSVQNAYGSNVLKSIQNVSLPILELLVREAIQNSSDAALEKTITYPMYAVNFNIADFQTQGFLSVLGEMGRVVKTRFEEERYKYLEIRDIYTSGMTGPITVEGTDDNGDDNGNFFKLVFDTGQEQTKSQEGDAGGSCGYGKSVYYQAGIGFVIFYSQIKDEKDDNKIKSRLIISYIENEKNPDALLREITEFPIGRAWWGKKAPTESRTDILPIEDNDAIEEILSLFPGVKPFKSSQTGTSIIIPFFDVEKMLGGIFPDECGVSDIDKSRCVWKDDIVEYIKLAIQKWYCPKLHNENLIKYTDQKWFSVKINGIDFDANDMRPMFQLFQELYTTAVSWNFSNDGNYYVSDKYPEISTKKIISTKLIGQTSGHVAYVKISRDKLSRGNGMLDPYIYLRKYNRQSNNDPIVFFARKAGMVIDYKCVDEWTDGLKRPESDDDYIFVCYVPKWNAQIKDNIALPKMTSNRSFGEYLRKCEKSDHMNWEDYSSISLINNVKGLIPKKVQEELDGTALLTRNDGGESTLQGILSRAFMPKRAKKRRIGNTTSGGGTTTTSYTSVDIIDYAVKIRESTLVLPVDIVFKNPKRETYLGIYVRNIGKDYNAVEWKKNIGTDFPITIESISDCKVTIREDGVVSTLDGSCDSENSELKNDNVSIRLDYSVEGILGFKISNITDNKQLHCAIEISTTDRKYSCIVKEYHHLQGGEKE